MLDVVWCGAGINQKFIKGKKSTSRVLRYRALFVAIAKENGFKYAQIGEFLNRKDSCVLKLKNKMLKELYYYWIKKNKKLSNSNNKETLKPIKVDAYYPRLGIIKKQKNKVMT